MIAIQDKNYAYVIRDNTVDNIVYQGRDGAVCDQLMADLRKLGHSVSIELKAVQAPEEIDLEDLNSCTTGSLREKVAIFLDDCPVTNHLQGKRYYDLEDALVYFIADLLKSRK